MSTTDPNDLRDPRFDAAWRAASHEEPPKALDDAIRAAARREAQSGPRSADATTTPVPSALRPESWWEPLAAAAVIGAIAIGLLQLTNTEHVGAPASDKHVVTDMPEAPAKAKVREDSARDAAAPAPSQSVTSAADRPQVPQTPAASPASSPVTSPAPSPPTIPATREQGRMSQPALPVAAPPPAAPPASPPALRKDTAAASVEERASANTAPAAEPFPADAVKREAKQVAGNVAPPAPPSPPMRMEDEASRAGADKLSVAPVQPPQSALRRDAQSAGAAVAQSAAPKPAAPQRQFQEGDAARESVATGGATSGKLDGAVEARAKTQARLSVPDWIALIRKLRDEGKMDDAAKELAGFRAAHPDHERLLPPDLRDWKPPAR